MKQKLYLVNDDTDETIWKMYAPNYHGDYVFMVGTIYTEVLYGDGVGGHLETLKKSSVFINLEILDE